MKNNPHSTPGGATRPQETEATFAIDPNAVCSECGAQGAFDFGHVKLCTRCYSEKGSCCPEFGKDDLWRLP